MIRPSSRSRFATAFSLAALMIAAGPSGTLSQTERFADTARVYVVEIPVQVIRDGEPVRDLTAADFEVLDGKKKREIVAFERVDLSVAAEPEEAPLPAPVPAAARRHFLFLFDLALSYPASVVRARRAARELVATSLHPTDLAAVGTYTSTRGAQLVLGFTSDRRQIELALETLGLPQMVQTRPDPLGIVYEDRTALRVTRNAAPETTRGVDAEGEILEILERIETEAGRAQEQNKVLALAGSLAELAGLMAAVEGNKHVIFLSEGFDSSILFGRGVDSQEDQRQIAQTAEAAASGEVWRVRSDERFGSTSTLNQIESMAQEFVRAGCTIQSVDIGGLRADADARPRRAADDGLYTLASKTGGDYYRNFNDLSQAMERMLERTSVTYLLAIQPDDLKPNGEFRRLKVRLKNDARGVDVSHRPGYFAPKPEGATSPLERRLQTADLVLAGREGGGVDTSVLAAAFDAGAEAAYVPVLIEIGGPSLMEGHTGDVLPVELYAYAIAADGGVADYFTQVLGLDLGKVRPALAQSGFKFWGDFELPPGRYTVRTVVRNSATGAAGVRSSRLFVPSFADREAGLSPPLFPEPAGKWLLGREQGATTGHDYPFLLDGAAFIPAARAVVPAGGAVPVALVGYNLGSSSLVLSGRLLTPSGEEVEGSRLQIESRSAASEAGREQLVGRFEAGSAPPGEYLLEVTAVDETSGTLRISSVALSIRG